MIVVGFIFLIIGCVADDFSLDNPKLPDLDGIVDADDADLKDYKYQVSLQFLSNRSHFCSGAIVQSNWILTTAHCLDDKDAFDIVVVPGSHLAKYSKGVNANKIYIHPKWNRTLRDYDFALLETTNSLSLGTYGNAIQISNSEPNFGYERYYSYYASGYLKKRGQFPLQLTSLETYVLEPEVCHRSYYRNNITDRMICTGTIFVACLGDPGAPLVDRENGKLYGLLSWGYGCKEKRYPLVYSKVSVAKDWIDEISHNSKLFPNQDDGFIIHIV